MMPSLPIDDSYHTCRPRWLAAGRKQARIRPLHWPDIGIANPVVHRADRSFTPM